MHFELFGPDIFDYLVHRFERVVLYPFKTFYFKRFHVFPICIRSHWILAVAEIKYKNIKGKNIPKRVDIKIMDSLELSERSEEAFSVLKRFYVTKIGNDYKVTLGSCAIKPHVDKKLIQPNGHDCGPFIIYNFWKG